MGRKPVRINTNDELDRRSRKILSRSERASKPHGPPWTKCKRCGGDAHQEAEGNDIMYHCLLCGQEWDC